MQRYLTFFYLLVHFINTPTVAQTVEGTVVHPLHVVILGDSNTWIGGDDCDKPKGWNKWFVDEFRPLSCKSYARSGATWTNTSTTRENVVEDIAVLGNDNVIYNQIARLKRACDEGRQQTPDLIIIAARPAMGKTAFVLSMCRNIAINNRVPVAMFSLEMSNFTGAAVSCFTGAACSCSITRSMTRWGLLSQSTLHTRITRQPSPSSTDGCTISRSRVVCVSR